MASREPFIAGSRPGWSIASQSRALEPECQNVKFSGGEILPELPEPHKPERQNDKNPEKKICLIIFVLLSQKIIIV